MTVKEAQNRIGIRIQDLYSAMIPVEEMLVRVGCSLDEEGSKAILTTKEDVYKQIVRYLRTEGYPESSPDFKEANINDLVLLIILPMIDDFMCRTGRQKVRLCREKQIVSRDFETGGNEEYVVIDQISLAEERYIFVVEAKRSSLGAAMGQCLVSMKDMGDNNGGGVVYSFVTTGESWRMLSYDGKSFQVTDKIDVMFGTIGKNKEKWMRDYSVLVDCMYTALNNGSTV
ncbi:hypothetical protein BDD12DRAFT_860159 [Trichophaea hybrida]|nr:hypothetical protein BDD12DRAFT_860159 [Trichophaea hybrida]